MPPRTGGRLRLYSREPGGGISGDVAYDGHEGAARLHLNPYDVVVLDRDLPGIHGDTLCRTITESEEPAMILMLTAAGAPDAGRPPTAARCEQPESNLTPTTGVVIRDRRSIALTAKERAVLEALLRASPGGLTAEQLVEQAWDENADPFTNTVRVAIGRLRSKLGEPQIIHTMPGIGYRIAIAETESDPSRARPCQ